MTPGKAKRGLAAVAGLSIALLLAAIAAGAAGPGIQPASGPASQPGRTKLKFTLSRQTTYAMGPLNADGTVDYIAVMNERLSKGIGPTNNAFVPLLGVSDPNLLPWVREGMVRQLRAALPGAKIEKPQRRQGYYFVSLYDLAESLPADQRLPGAKPIPASRPADFSIPESRQLNAAAKSLWSARDYPVLAKWLTANDKPLAALVGASSLPRFYVPSVANLPGRTLATGASLQTTSLPVSTFCQAIEARAMLRFAGGDVAGARADMLAVHRWARLVAQGSDLISRLEGAAVERYACQAEQALAASGKLTAAQARAFLADLNGLGDIAGLADVIDGESRLKALDTVMFWGRQGIELMAWDLRRIQPLLARMRDPHAPTSNPIILRPWRRVDPGEPNWDIALKLVNFWCDRQVIALSEPTYPARKAANEALAKELEGLTGGMDDGAKAHRIQKEASEAAAGNRQALDQAVRHVGEYVTVDIVQFARKGSPLTDETNTQLRLTKLSLALAACRADTGAYPKALADLMPAYISAVPADLFTGKPLIYKPTGGGYILYSVGANMQDDGGKERQAGGDDVVVRVGASVPAPAR